MHLCSNSVSQLFARTEVSKRDILKIRISTPIFLDAVMMAELKSVERQKLVTYNNIQCYYLSYV